MPHFRQSPLFEKHYIETGSDTFTHTYKGVEYEIKQGMEDRYSAELLQSISTRLKNLYPSRPIMKPVPTPTDGDETDKLEEGPMKAPGENHEVVKKITAAQLIRNELLRLSRVEVIVEDKLHYPRVFKRLLSEPHLALYETKKVVDVKQELYLFVDEAVGYNDKDNGFHHTLIQEASKIKGIHVFHDCGLKIKYKGDRQYFWNVVPKIVPLGKKVLAISQGCGGTSGYYPKGYDLHFVTHFRKGYSCGCDTISSHEHHKCKMHYGIDVPEKLKLLQL